MNKMIVRLIITSGLLLGSSGLFAESVVVVHPSNNSVFTADAIADIFLGKSRSFSNGERAVAISPEESSEAKQAFNSKVLNKTTSQLNKYWSKLIFTGKAQPPKSMVNDDAIKQQIAVETNVIGIIDAKSVDDSVKVVYRF